MSHGFFAFPGRLLARFLSRPDPRYEPLATSPPELLAAALRPCDVLLIEGNTRISTAIKYLTQSTWSHAALYLGVGPFAGRLAGEQALIEADLVEGIRLVPLREYAHMHSRICRPVGLVAEDEQGILGAALARLGDRYDLKNMLDLARLFQAVRYPILPRIERRPSAAADCNTCYDEIAHIRHHSLFVPRDFDVSPYFRIVKPSLEAGFDHRAVQWAGELEPAS